MERDPRHTTCIYKSPTRTPTTEIDLIVRRHKIHDMEFPQIWIKTGSRHDSRARSASPVRTGDGKSKKKGSGKSLPRSINVFALPQIIRQRSLVFRAAIIPDDCENEVLSRARSLTGEDGIWLATFDLGRRTPDKDVRTRVFR